MSDSAVIAAHDRAGCVEPARLAVRVGEATAAAPAESSPLAGEVPFRSGVSGVGPLELRIEVDAEGDVAHVDTRVRNPSERPLWLESAVLGFRWSRHGVRAMRFLRHGWQSWSYTGARALDEAGEPPFAAGPWLRGLHHAVGAPPPDRAGWHESDLVTVIGASPGGFGTISAQSAWLPVFRSLRARFWMGGRLMVSGAHEVFEEQGRLADADIRERLAEFVSGFVAFCGE